MQVTGKLMIEKVLENHPNKHHPRLVLTERDFAFWAAHAEADDVFGRVYRRQKCNADRLLTQPVVKYSIPDGIRILGPDRGVVAAPPCLGFYYRVTGDKKYARRCIDELLAFASYPDWNPYHFLDVGDISTGFALGYDWCYDAMTEEERKTLRRAMYRFAFLPILDDYRDLPRRRTYKWYQTMPGNNWKFICNGGVSLLALAICDEDESGLCEEILGTAWTSNYNLIRDAYDPTDGSYVEGLSYWQYALLFLTQYAAGVKTACGSDFDLTDAEGIRKTGYFPKRLSSNRFVSFNFGDASEINPCSPAYLWLAEEFDMPDLATLRIKRLENVEESDLRDLFFLKDFSKMQIKPLGTDFGCIGATNATFRTGWDVETDLYAGIHFGANFAPHAHFDMGTFILEYRGKRFFSELGLDDYNLRPYQGCYRYRAEGHNTLVFNPSGEPDQERNAECYIDRYAEGDEALASADISAAYGGGRSVRREIKMEKPTKTVTVTDEIACSGEDVLYWFAHTKADIDLQNGGKEALLTLEGVKLRAKILFDGAFTVMEAKPFPTSPKTDRPQSENVGFRKLAIRLTGKDSYRLAVTFAPEK